MLAKRWVQIGVLALAIFVVNAASRLITWQASIVDADEQLRLGMVALVCVTILLIAASAWWAVRHPFGRIFADVCASAGIGGLLCLLIGPFLGGSTPFASGLGFFVGQVLMFAALAAVGMFLGFGIVVAFGKDWKSKGLRQFEQARSRAH
jgi:hypothetical protein